MTKKTQPLDAAAALQWLKDGNARYVEDKLNYERHDSSTRTLYVGDQVPDAVILSCADSRVVPELIFDAGVSDLFVVRVAGNVANTCSIASIEYAVFALKVNLIVVLGHEACGAVKAAIGGDELGHNLNTLLAHLKPAVASIKEGEGDEVKQAVQSNAQLTAAHLRERSTILSQSSVEIVPAYYNLGSGKVDFL